eukprot:TRINITY_DN37937_c0_g1_i1.p1 TRINITY_DN37937_c0_g1~~TRINITY_DN37937_c0_g1_i1.p1  ORF type:complete len:411 (+),score=43.71 TRINITY_DN37937_c0_g1_i1:49-1281(+)
MYFKHGDGLVLMSWTSGQQSMGFPLKILISLVVSVHGAPVLWPKQPHGLPSGAPPWGMLAAELDPTSEAYGSWVTKNDSSLEEFLKYRIAYITDDASFKTFRRTATQGWRTGTDGQYDAIHPDTGRMLAVMESSVWGRALLEGSRYHVAQWVDGVGSPLVFPFGRHGSMSPDLFSGFFKLTLLLQSFGDFSPVPGLSDPPVPGDLYAGPRLIPLLAEWDIIEVGAGPGFFASTFVNALHARSYSILDLPTQQHMQWKFLSQTVELEKAKETFVFIPCCSTPQPPRYFLPSYSLFISHSALAELSPQMRERYYYCCIIRSKRGFIIDNFEDIHSHRFAEEKDGKPVRTDDGKFSGLDLVWRLQDLGFDVKIRTHQELLGVPNHRSRAVVITWASMGLEDVMIHGGDQTNRG